MVINLDYAEPKKPVSDLVNEARALFANEPPWTVETHDARGDYVRIALVRRDPSFECGYYVIADDDMQIRREQATADFRRFIQCRILLSQLCNELDQQVSLNRTQASEIDSLMRNIDTLNAQKQTQAESLSTCHARMKLMKDAIEAAIRSFNEWGYGSYSIVKQLTAAIMPKGEQK